MINESFSLDISGRQMLLGAGCRTEFQSTSPERIASIKVLALLLGSVGAEARRHCVAFVNV